MNRVELIGRLTKDIELRTAGTTSVAKFNLAVDKNRKVKDGEATADFIPITIFGKAAENAAKYIGKGRLVAVAGRIQSGSYDKDGKRIYTLDVIGDEIQFLDRADAARTAAPKEEGLPEGMSILDDDEIPF